MNTTKPTDPQTFLDHSLEFRRRGNYRDCLANLIEGNRLHPKFKDVHGHRVFAKEFVRTKIFMKDYSGALHGLVEFGLDINEHAILFARGFESDRNIEAARAWWIRFAEAVPDHPESKKFFESNKPNLIDSYCLNQNIVDIKNHFPDTEFKVVFDVGANVGQSISGLLSLSKDANVHCFEPSRHSYSILKKNYGNDKRLILNNIAISDHEGTASFLDQISSTMGKIDAQGRASEVVDIATIDKYSADKSISGIDYLKIDTEGHELSVLRGWSRMAQFTRFVELEASMNPYNQYHVSFIDICQTMFDKGFYLLGVYEQVREWGGGGLPMLRRANLVFFNKDLVGELPKGLITN